MVSLARKTLYREWRRFLPAVLAVAFAGLLLIVQVALVMGIFGSAAVYITASSADVWVGYPGTQSVNLGRPVGGDIEMLLRMNNQVTEVEPLLWVDADWRSQDSTTIPSNQSKDSDTNTGGVSVFVNGINPNPHGMLFDDAIPPHLRTLLMEPGAVIIDRADQDQLGIQANNYYARIDGKQVHVVATVSGLRALGGVNVICSTETARSLGTHSFDNHKATYWVARVKQPALASQVALQLAGNPAFGPYEAWSAADFARRSQLYWMLDTGAGVAVLFMATIVFLVGIVVASQALMSVVISSSREYATLNALGAGMAALRKVVLEQATWIGSTGLLLSAAFSGILLTLANAQDVPVDMTPTMAIFCGLLVLSIALISGLFAMRGLMRANTALLLR